MGTIRRRVGRSGRVTFEVQVRVRGVGQITQTFDRRSEAKAWEHRTQAMLRERKVYGAVESRRHTLGEAIDRYCADYLPLLAESDQGRRKALLMWWRKRLGDRRLSEFSPALVTEYRDRLARGEGLRGKRLAAGRQNRYLASLSRVFSVAVREWGWTDQNPVTMIERRPEGKGRMMVLEDAERRALLAACLATDRTIYDLAILALATAARQGELLKLRWPDVDLGRAVLRFRDTKNREDRTVPLTPPAIAVLEERRRVRSIADQRVFAGRFPQSAWERARKAAELPTLRFHDLRHCAASYLAMSGATLAEIAEVLGHKTLAMVKRYSHFTVQHTASVVGRMAEKFLQEPAASGDSAAAIQDRSPTKR